MTQQEALQVLINSVKIANKRGAFELEESSIIMEAISTFMVEAEKEIESENKQN